MSARRAVEGLLDFLLPTGCVSCRAWIPQAPDPERATPIVCQRCRSRLATASWPRCLRCHAPRGTGRDPGADCLECRAWPEALARARYAHVLVPPATDLVHALKYEGWRELAGLMGRAMVACVSDGVDATSAVVVPVPTTASRIRSRGYNQARLLAEVVASVFCTPLVDALERRRAPASQTTLSPRARRDNVRGAFGLREDAGRVRGRDVLLVDDVLTTGATAGEAALTLAAAAPRSVGLVTYGRALPRSEAGSGRPRAA